ncbi:hypothetical protein [Alicyclobacillus tolerans]|uniref:hypothetical protein n=1 Tax=Alicyclobacillus tolerans TaxID=90970 RepID=UPI0013F4E4FB|nr:hypothetical protein [Alicyclobacillus montanus]
MKLESVNNKQSRFSRLYPCAIALQAMDNTNIGMKLNESGNMRSLFAPHSTAK